MNFIKLGAMLPLGAAGDSDDSRTELACVIELCGLWFAYYVAYDGAIYHLCGAVSEDGVHFTKLGAVIPKGASGESDDVKVYEHGVLVRDGMVYIYYTGFDGSWGRVCLAVSEDGIHFIKLGVLLPKGASNEIDAQNTLYGTPIVCNGIIYLYYESVCVGSSAVALAVSEDGIHFTKLGIVNPATAGSRDQKGIFAPYVALCNGQVMCLYAGIDGSYAIRCCLAYAEDGIRFTKQGVVIPLGAAGQIDATYVYETYGIIRDGMLYAYYQAINGTVRRTALAVAEI